MTAIRFAKDCIDDWRYAEANFIYEWLWSMSVLTDSEYGEPVDRDMLSENRIISVDMKQLALLTLYADYQVQQPENRAEDLFLYFGMYAFQQLHIEEMFHAGRENLTDTEQFWRDWIALLQTKRGDVVARLLQETVLYREGVNGLVKLADENGNQHPSLYLSAIKEYDRNHEYTKIEEIGRNAMKNLLRLFGTKEIAAKYGLRGKDISGSCKKGEVQTCTRDVEMKQNYIGEHTRLELCFYTGQFSKVKEASKNPKGSLGWSGGFIPYGIRMLLLYLYEKTLHLKRYPR